MKTCEDLKNSPYNDTGVYTMDPDGSGHPVEVFCDMEKGVTEVRCILSSQQTTKILPRWNRQGPNFLKFLYPQIGHDHLSAENVTWCSGVGCYSLNLTYDIPIQVQIFRISLSPYPIVLDLRQSISRLSKVMEME